MMNETHPPRTRLRHAVQASSYAVKLALAVWLLLTAVLIGCSGTSAVLFDDDQVPLPLQHIHSYDYHCPLDDKDDTSITLNLRQSPIGLQVTDHVVHQLMTRIFAIFLREKLNYRNISLIALRFNGNINNKYFEQDKLKNTLQLISHHPNFPDMSMINLNVWMPSNAHINIPTNVFDAGLSMTPGRFGWFVKESQLSNASSIYNSLNYNIFLDPTSYSYDQFVISDDVLENLHKDRDWNKFTSNRCVDRKCVTLLAEYRYDSGFIEQELNETGIYVNVLWLNSQFNEKINWLSKLYETSDTFKSKRFVVLHWTPSVIIDSEIKFQQIIMPRCEELRSLQNANCKYELTPVLKYYSKSVMHDDNNRLSDALNRFLVTDSALRELFGHLKLNRRRLGSTVSSEDLYNVAACNWLMRNYATYSDWISEESSITLYIGGIFPITESSRGHQNLVGAVQSAANAININNTVLPNYKLVVHENDGQCKADMVMKAFIHYFIVPRVLGVLGPACSETVEPIAGISKHTNMAVISYSAEGASFVDRQAYPFFFRTIGSNRQYEDVYISLMQRLGWRRFAALTEDGQKYTEYISHMEATMKQTNLELIINKKFLSDVTATEMNKYLGDLKQRRAKIIIADIHKRNADLALCEAYKLDMTAYNGYVWFLPSWISKDWSLSSGNSSNESCTTEELRKAFDGHFSIMHTPFGESTSQMQEQISIQKWLENYNGGNKSISKYTGFAYDAVWTYALAADKLLRENKDAVNNLRSNTVVKRFVELIWQTDFAGLSGRVRFGQGGSRITELNIMQWRNSQFQEVGKFYPEVQGKGSSLRPNGGQLVLHEDNIVWLSGQKPGDGTYDCSFAALAVLLHIDCNSAAVGFIVVVFLLAVIVVSLVSFLFWKKRYDAKLKQSAKIMKNFGIDLLSPSRSKHNTLDKWEIPKENVIVNRRLGEGAFGTVYGGEAQLGAEGWTAVAVKTLKAGASTEDRLDFLSEAEAMKRFDHKNIVKLLGVCLQSEPIYTIMEFMLYGDLKTYLLARRHMVNDKISEESDISSKRLTMYAMDVARGLAYLAEQKYVHRDIACRNCLVNAQRVVKLGDFGMARPTLESDYYRFNRKGMLPVRWMAPEALALGMFTPASDVWAFGVVLYEIITFGSFPYQGLTNNQVLEYVKSRKTLQIPTGVKPHLEGLIKACWSQEVKKRPTASEIVEYVSNNPRLLTSCLDFPGASVEMPETESDELELLPKARKCSPIKKDSTLDILPQSSANNLLERHTDFSDDLELPQISCVADIPAESLKVPSINLDTFSPTTPDGYSIMSPLLLHQVSECSDSSQARLLKKSPTESMQTPF